MEPELELELSKQLEEAQRSLAEDEQTHKRLLENYQFVFTTDAGEAVLKDLKNAFYEKTWLNDEGSEYATIAGEGKRFVILYILAKLEELDATRRT